MRARREASPEESYRRREILEQVGERLRVYYRELTQQHGDPLEGRLAELVEQFCSRASPDSPQDQRQENRRTDDC
jgi:hypothetical protein